MASKKSTAVLQPNMGIYSDRDALATNPRMLVDGLNFRVKLGKLSNLNIGWQRFGSFQLNGPVMLIQDFFQRSGVEQLVLATTTDIYRYVNSTTISYLTPRYGTGTISSVAAGVITGSGTSWATNADNNDEISFAANVTSPSATWYPITLVTDNTHITVSGSPPSYSGAYTIRRKFSGTTANIWNAAQFINASPSGNDELWMTNGLDQIVRWDGSSNQVEVMSALGFTAKTLVVYQNMMLFFNLVQGGTNKPTDMINSNPGEPQNVTTGLSEQFKVHPYEDEIIAAVPIGDNLAIYSYTDRGVVTLANFVGDPLVFTFRQASRGNAPISPKMVANFGPYHEFLSRDSQYYFDGATVKTINKHFWRSYLTGQDAGRVINAFSAIDPENGDIIWAIPLTSDPKSATTGLLSQAGVEHYLEDPGANVGTPHSKRSFPFYSAGYFKRQTGLTWDTLTQAWTQYSFRWNDRFFSSTFPLIVVGDDVGKLYTINTAQDADGVALGSYVRFGRRPVVDGRMRGIVQRVYPFVTSFTNPIQVSLLMADSVDGNAAIVDTQNFDQTQPQGGHFTIHYRRGRFLQLHFSTNGPSQPWELAGYDYDVKGGGRR